MRVYIDKFNINILQDLIDNLLEYKINSEEYIRLYTENGIYEINNKKIYLLESVDKKIIKYKNFYDNFTLIVDPSYFNKLEENFIDGIEHCSFQTKKNIYKINSYNKLKLVIELNLVNDKYEPNDIYFDYENEININELFIKQEIIEFLSLLN